MVHDELGRELARELDKPPVGRDADTSRYLREVADRPPPTLVRERELVARAQAGDAAARAQLVEAFLPLIGSVARVYRSAPALDHLELMQEGVVGLLRALEGFDPERGTPFWAYAGWWVRQAMQQLVAELTRPMVLSDHALRQLSRLRDAHNDHIQRHGGEPSRAQLAEATGISDDQVAALIAAERVPRGLDDADDGDEEALGRFGELLVDPLAEAEYERVLAGAEVDELRSLLAALSDRERSILRARFGLDGAEQSRGEVAQQLGISAERVRQLEQRALGKMRSAAQGDGSATRR